MISECKINQIIAIMKNKNKLSNNLLLRKC